MSAEFEYKRYGDEFVFTWPTEGVGITVKGIREDRHDIFAMLQPHQLVAGDLQALAGPKRTNLCSSRGLAEVVGGFAKRYKFGRDEEPPSVDDFTWGDAIETVASIVMDEWGRGEPVIDLSSVESPIDLPYLIHPYLPLNEATVFYGDNQSAKSMFMMLLALSVRTGTVLPYAKAPCETGNVLYLDYETVKESQSRRLGRVAAGLELATVPQGIYYRRCVRPLDEDAPRITADVERFQVKLVVIDSLAWACGSDPNDSTTAIRIMGIARQLGVTVAIVAHTSKAERQEKGKRSIFGSVFFEHGPRSAWEIRAQNGVRKGLMQQAIFHRKANDDVLRPYPIGQTVEFVDDVKRSVRFYREEIGAGDELAQGTSLSSRLRSLLLRAKRPVSVEQIIAGLGDEHITDAAIRTTITRMKGDVINLAPAGQPARYGMSVREDGTKPTPEAAQPQLEAPPAEPMAKPEDLEECSACLRKAPPHRYTDDGKALCITCADGD